MAGKYGSAKLPGSKKAFIGDLPVEGTALALAGAPTLELHLLSIQLRS